MARTITIAALVGMLSATPAGAGTDNNVLSGEELLRLCEGSAGYCAGFAAGLAIGVDVGKWESPDGTAACLPQVTFSQMEDVLTKYLRDHPEHRHHSAINLVTVAILTAWPDACIGEAAQ
jgi:Rap1a immunity proteins